MNTPAGALKFSDHTATLLAESGQPIAETLLATIESLCAAVLRLEAVIGNVQAGVVVEDDQGQIVLTNQTFAAMMALTLPPETLIGSSLRQVFRQSMAQFADADTIVRRLDTLRRRQKPVQSEVPCPRKRAGVGV